MDNAFLVKLPSCTLCKYVIKSVFNQNCHMINTKKCLEVKCNGIYVLHFCYKSIIPHKSLKHTKKCNDVYVRISTHTRNSTFDLHIYHITRHVLIN